MRPEKSEARGVRPFDQSASLMLLRFERSLMLPLRHARLKHLNQGYTTRNDEKSDRGQPWLTRSRDSSSGSTPSTMRSGTVDEISYVTNVSGTIELRGDQLFVESTHSRIERVYT